MRHWPVLALFPFLFTCSASPTHQDGRATASGKLVIDSSGYAYDPSDKSCDGFPRLQVGTMPGTCLGLVVGQDQAIDSSTKQKLVMPRTLVAIPGTKEFLVVDMGGWAPNKGGIFWLKPNSNGAYQLHNVKTGLNLAHGLAFGPGGYFYVGESQAISRFHFSNGKISDWQPVVTGLPRFKGHMHPLTQFTFDPRNGDLYINSGAPSDHCFVKQEGGYSYCPESEGTNQPDSSKVQQAMGAIFRIIGERLNKIPPGGITTYEIVAQGLRNSMAMAVHPSGNLLEGENGRDFPQVEEPYEKLNVVPLNSNVYFHYGWPYCYDYRATSPEWKFSENAKSDLRKTFTKVIDCTKPGTEKEGGYRPPHALMPPHVAPLDMKYYEGDSLRSLLGGKLLVSWHGYQPAGQRLVAYDVDSSGRPLLRAWKPGETYSFNQKSGCPAPKAFKPDGGIEQVAPYTEVISNWAQVKGKRPTGAPVGFTTASDGSIWIAEDRKNRTIVRLARFNGPAYNDDCGDGRARPAEPDPRVNLLAWRNAVLGDAKLKAGFEAVQNKLTLKYCQGCHGNFQETDIGKDAFSQLDFFVKNEWIEPRKAEASKLYQAIAQTGELPPMPPGGAKQFFGTSEGDEILRTVSAWINAIPADMGARVQRTNMKDARKLRAKPSASSTACGMLDKGTVVYIDPRKEAQVKAEGWLWTKAYILPGDSRLFAKTCPYPLDGTFWIAATKL
jgi:glucose/arabinose dehydrogenase